MASLSLKASQARRKSKPADGQKPAGSNAEGTHDAASAA
jgi:hypothetical protein